MKREAEEIGRVRMFIFGSILRKKEIPRDIDILIISPQLKDFKQKTNAELKFGQKSVLAPHSKFIFLHQKLV